MRKAIHFVDGTCIERIARPEVYNKSKSGHRGVYLRENNRWRASIGFQGKLYNLGSFGSMEEAIAARLAAEKLLYKPFLEKYYQSVGENKKETQEAGETQA